MWTSIEGTTTPDGGVLAWPTRSTDTVRALTAKITAAGRTVAEFEEWANGWTLETLDAPDSSVVDEFLSSPTPNAFLKESHEYTHTDSGGQKLVVKHDSHMTDVYFQIHDDPEFDGVVTGPDAMRELAQWLLSTADSIERQ